MYNLQLTLPELVTEFYRHEEEVQPIEHRDPDPTNIIYDHYHAVVNNSQQILCCYGDSYTKGCCLGANRLEHVFGSLVSKQLNMDWFNAGGAGYGNIWMLSQLEFMIDWLNASSYTGGIIVLTFTENARDIKNYSHYKFDYLTAYQKLPVEESLYDQVCDDIELVWIDRTKKIREKLDSKFQIIAGMNFVWHDRLAQALAAMPGVKFINLSWIELLALSGKLEMPPRASITYLETVDTLNTILNITDRSAYKQWYLNKADQAQAVMDWMANTPMFFGKYDLGHPNAAGHKLWADQIIKCSL
jgi:hypothetical protein